MKSRVLYLSYDGLTDQLGLSQILPYLHGLAALGHEITVVSCEKAARMKDAAERVAAICEVAGIDWQPIRYHKSPPILSGLYDIAAMMRRAAQLHRRKRFGLIHCRSYIPTIAGDWLKRRSGVPLLFDMRGFWADERIERGFWPRNHLLFRAAHSYFKHLEKRFLRDADAVVCLTENARREIESWPGPRRAAITVIPCCVDLDLFNSADCPDAASTRKALGIEDDALVMVYVGSLGRAYLADEMFRLFGIYRAVHPGARFLIVSTHDARDIERQARAAGIEAGAVIVTAAARHEVPALIAAANLGVCFILPTFAAKASCPTKLGEMLAMGVPVVANSRVGDIEEIVRETGAGAIVHGFDDRSLATAIHEAERAAAESANMRAAAIRCFALEDGIRGYDAVYRAVVR